MQVSYCNPVQQLCVKNMTQQNHGCRTSCTGLHADVTHTDDSLTKFIIDQIEKQQNNLARGIWYIDSLHFNDDKFYSVSRSVQFGYYDQEVLNDVLYPDKITSNNVEYEQLKENTKYVTVAHLELPCCCEKWFISYNLLYFIIIIDYSSVNILCYVGVLSIWLHCCLFATSNTW